MKSQTNTVDGLTVIPTGAALGAEIRGLDLSLPLPKDTVAGLRQALLDHCVVFFRDQELSDQDQVRFTNYFGKAEVHVRDMPDRPVKEILFVSNIKEDGKAIGALGDGEINFHSDLAYMPKPGATFAGMIINKILINSYKFFDILTTSIRIIKKYINRVIK